MQFTCIRSHQCIMLHNAVLSSRLTSSNIEKTISDSRLTLTYLTEDNLTNKPNLISHQATLNLLLFPLFMGVCWELLQASLSQGSHSGLTQPTEWFSRRPMQLPASMGHQEHGVRASVTISLRDRRFVFEV